MRGTGIDTRILQSYFYFYRKKSFFSSIDDIWSKIITHLNKYTPILGHVNSITLNYTECFYSYHKCAFYIDKLKSLLVLIFWSICSMKWLALWFHGDLIHTIHAQAKGFEPPMHPYNCFFHNLISTCIYLLNYINRGQICNYFVKRMTAIKNMSPFHL